MSLLSDRQIKDLVQSQGMIDPFVDSPVEEGVISFGAGSYGYDCRVGNRFKVFDSPLRTYGRVIDPKCQDWHNSFTDYNVLDHEAVSIPPNSFCLAETLETFKIPRNVLCVCMGKSTYHRCGVIVGVTPLEPEWCGKVTVEISNTTPLPAKIYAGEGIMQVLFFWATHTCERSYKDRKGGGKYQSQTGLTLPFVKGKE